ncbi:hypothetical protein [Pimelobacter simplex]|uniref:hypothetical protein n=1 Tax=Nocardioides simplex TaxID=2045 RepID=UPI00214FD5D1|nr:hypothetical protein [Pimelobacter simplex]UUW87696.1 hypothetical protein M0M43_18350 [Pimelobacter simplex]UUW97202.1 hypothetical protein M0M48_07000 [Pimelobacter simplex]
MPALRLRSEASIGVLAADLFVLWLALAGVRDEGAPSWTRLACLAVVVLAIALGVHSLVLLGRRVRAGRRRS